MSARCATCRGNGYICFVLRDKCRKVRERNKVAPVQGPMPLDWVAEQFLDALTEEFMVLHRDDVAEERADCEVTITNGVLNSRPKRRLVTRWEPITKEDVGPWTTQETP